MPPSIARSEPAPDSLLAPGFGRRADDGKGRWPAPVAAAFILALSAGAWMLIFQGVRLAASLAG